MQGSPHRLPQQSPQHLRHHPGGHSHVPLRPNPAPSARPAQVTAAATANKPKAYNPRHPERTLLYKTVAEHFETWLELASAGQFDGQGDHHSPPAYVEKAFRKYLECGIFAHGFARVRCDDCGDDFLVAFSCKGRGVCPSCNTRRMAEAAAHLTDHVFPRLPVRQWVLSVPKRIRYYLQRDKGALNAALRIYLRVVQQSLVAACPGAANADPASLHIGAVAFIHRFGSSLNTHVHFHVCVVDGVFEALADADSVNAPSITFHPAQIDDAAITQMQAAVQTNIRKRLLRAFVARGHLESHDAKDMNERATSRQHGCGFSVDAGVRIEATDRAGLERLLRYCARPPFAMDRLKQRGADLVYRCGKGHTAPLQSDKCSGELVLTPLELIHRIAQLVPPPRTHRHRYYGVLAPNSPLRAVVTAMAQVAAVSGPVPSEQVVGSSPMVVQSDTAAPTEPPSKPKPRPAAHYLWAALIARIYEVFPLLCPNCGGQMRIIAFITFSADIHRILDHIGVEPEAPRITPARGPPLWDACGAQEAGEGVEAEPDWDMEAQPLPDYSDDQRTTW
jgi:hypothetical protein